MKDCLDANVTHAFYFSSINFSNSNAFVRKVKQFYPQALQYDISKNTDNPYFKDMQTAQSFLHGGGQTYPVYRFLLEQFSPDLQEAGLSRWCVMLSYFSDTNAVSISFHYGLENITTDKLIAIRQSGVHKQYSFNGQALSCNDILTSVCKTLGLPSTPIETSYLCEITKFGEYTDLDKIEDEQIQRLYGFITGDEGYEFVPEDLCRERLSRNWGSRNFMRIYAIGKGFLFLNLIGSPAHTAYLERQTKFGTATYNSCNEYFFMGSCPLTVNHGILFSVEFVMILKSLISDVLAFQSEHSKKSGSYYRRIQDTRDFRRKIIMVLEKVEQIEITEIGELSGMLLESQHIAPIVDQVKYLLELLEGDLSLMYSERNNTLVTVLTVLGLILAAWQVLLALI